MAGRAGELRGRLAAGVGRADRGADRPAARGAALARRLDEGGVAVDALGRHVRQGGGHAEAGCPDVVSGPVLVSPEGFGSPVDATVSHDPS